MRARLFYGTSEVAEILGVEETTIRHYMSFFNINIGKQGGKLAFREKDIEKIRKRLVLAKEDGLRLEGVKKALRAKSERNEELETLELKLINIKRILMLLKENFEG